MKRTDDPQANVLLAALKFGTGWTWDRDRAASDALVKLGYVTRFRKHGADAVALTTAGLKRAEELQRG